MRTSAALLVAIAAVWPAAAQAGDRFSGYGLRGPTRQGAEAQAPDPQPYGGPLLGWSSKRQATAPGAKAPVPEPMALAGQFAGGPVAASAAQAPTSNTRRPPQAFQPQMPYAMQQQAYTPPASADPLPQSLYGAPAAATRAPALAPPPSAEAPAAPRAAAPEFLPDVKPRLMADAGSAPQAAGGSPRFYSVHRGYGLTPDAVPTPTPGQQQYVLIGPPDGGTERNASDDDEDEDEGPGQRPF